MSLETFTTAYIEAALWSSDVEETEGGISPELQATFERDCAKFYASHTRVIEEAQGTDERAGHDFWLTRCGHGAGFWDGDWPEPQATILDNAARAFGNVDLYVGDDGLIYGM